MSKDIYIGNALAVTRFVGPASEGQDRQRWQFTPLGATSDPLGHNYAVLDRREVRTLIRLLLRDAWRVPRNVEDA